MRHTLVTIPFSHFCEKARWSLEAAGVPFVEEGHCPVLHRPAVKRAGGRGSVPVLVVDGGRAIDDSPLIVAYADAQAAAGRKLWPEGKARDEGLALERAFDVDFAPHVRRFVYFHFLPRRDITLTLFAIDTPRSEHRIARVAFPVIRALMRRFMRVHEPGMRRSRDAMSRGFDAVAARLRDGRPYLLGDRFSAADIAFASFAAPMVHPPEHPKVRVDGVDFPADYLAAVRDAQAHPAGEFARRVYRERRGTASA
ncbi:MAG TPA: glutathione S-transferase [Polyangiaceae bacterium]|nr:glutathione S-transferase [Polyangiaceae bacterium]